jgi:4-hydroxy-3-methylbut-2-enyl diphosphate reductase
MKIIVANPRGFCAGVNMAIECVDQVLRLMGPPIYVYHQIVHNRHVVSDFESRGVKFVDRVEQVPVGAVLVYSAHGVAPSVRQAAKERKLVEIDATCPLVTKVHLEVLRFARDGYTVVFVGHRNHDETIGTMGEAPHAMLIVERPQEVEALHVPDPQKVAYVTQTTLSVNEATDIIAALRQRFPLIKSPPREDICYATTNRQDAVAQLAPEADLVLVIGSHNSSNSLRLVETAVRAGRSAYLIDDASEIQPQWFEGKQAVLVTAGASAPEHLVRQLLERLQREMGGVVEMRQLVQEDVSFQLPQSLKRLELSRQ